MNKKKIFDIIALCLFVFLCILFIEVNNCVQNKHQANMQLSQQICDKQKQLDSYADSVDKAHELTKDCDDFMNIVYKDMYNYTVENLNNGNIDGKEAEKEFSDLLSVTQGKYDEFVRKQNDVYNDDLTDEQKEIIKRELDAYDKKFNERIDSLNKTIQNINAHKKVDLHTI